MSIDLSALLQRQDAYEEFTPQLDLEQIALGDTGYDVNIKSPMLIKVTSVGEGEVKVEYTCDLSIAIPCARCLKPVDYDFHIEGIVEGNLNDTNDEAGEDKFFFIEKKTLYPELLLVDEVLMKWPIRVLCKADCKGICSRCGADLNVTECGCEREAPDLRMAAIKDIFSQFKEV